ncbi:MAG: endonuclease V [Deltaproteobacteria bacterium]|nr:endonuclease V [Deltaproteobacteria bacterium]
MKICRTHSWTLSYREAVALQQKLAKGVRICRPPKMRLIGGTDVSYDLTTRRFCAAIVIWDCATQKVVETARASGISKFPYIPGLLSFREIPTLLDAFENLQTRPDGIICDGQGIAHPRRFGLASHLGLLLKIPTVGCAKSRLIGTHKKVGNERGSWAWLLDETVEGGREKIGIVLRTRAGVRPLYVSPGHLIDFSVSRELVLACAIRYRLPEPVRIAHLTVAKSLFLDR